MFHLLLAFPFLPDRDPAACERYWLESHGPAARTSPAVTGGYVQSHRIDVDPSGPRPRFEGVAESWAPAQASHELYPLLTGPPPDFANFLDITRGLWSIGRDRTLFGGGGYGGSKSLHLLHGFSDGAERTLRELIPALPGVRRLVLCVREPEFRWVGSTSIDLSVHAWVTDPSTVAEVGLAIDAALAGVPGLEPLLSARVDEIVMVPPVLAGSSA